MAVPVPANEPDQAPLFEQLLLPLQLSTAVCPTSTVEGAIPIVALAGTSTKTVLLVVALPAVPVHVRV